MNMYLIKGYYLPKNSESMGKRIPYIEFTFNLDESKKKLLMANPGFPNVYLEVVEYSNDNPPSPESIISYYYGIDDIFASIKDDVHAISRLALCYLYYRLGIPRYHIHRRYQGNKGFSFSNIKIRIDSIEFLRNYNCDNRYGRLRLELATFLLYLKPFRKEICENFYQYKLKLK